ncbi:hypothetical protein I548_0898 [Mycobacterium intracellulare]|nr:hypothetical protein I548_0898 [Mycobacterium intracellulare]
MVTPMMPGRKTHSAVNAANVVTSLISPPVYRPVYTSAISQETAPLSRPATRPASSQVIARSPRRSGSGLAMASARPSRTPHTATPMTNSSSSTTLNKPAWVCHALISAPWNNRTTTIAAAYTNPRSIQLLMAQKRSEYRQDP